MNGLNELLAEQMKVSESNALDNQADAGANTAPAAEASTVEGSPANEADVNLEADAQVTTQADVNTSTDNDDDVLTQEITRFKTLVDFDGELEDFSVDSIATVINSKVEKEREAIKSLQEDSDIKAIMEWKQKGYDLESFLKAPVLFDKKAIDVERDGDDVLKHAYKSKGLSDVVIESILGALELEPEKKQQEVNNILDSLETQSKTEYDSYLAEIESKKQDSLNAVKAITTVIDSGNLGYTTIPTEKIGDFKKYLNSAEVQKKWDSLTPEKSAMIEYLIYTDFNIDSFKKSVAAQTAQQTQKRNAIQIVNVTSAKKVTNSSAQDELLNKLFNK